MAIVSKKLFHKETIRCPLSVLSMIAIISALAVDLMIFAFVAPPSWSAYALIWLSVFSTAVFIISFFYSALRYRVKLKISKGIIDDRIFLSLRGVGKGTWLKIPLESIVSCKEEAYSSTFRNFPMLLFSSNAPIKDDSGYFVYPLPGYRGRGVYLEYRTGGEVRKILIPSRDPERLCQIIAINSKGPLPII